LLLAEIGFALSHRSATRGSRANGGVRPTWASLLEARPFCGRHFLIHAERLPLLHDSARPADLQLVDHSGIAHPEVQYEAVLRIEAAAAHHFADPGPASGCNQYARPDAAAVRLCTNDSHVQEIPAGSLVLQQRRCAVHVYDDDLGPAISVKIAGGQAARGPRYLKGRSRDGRHIGKATVSEIAEQESRLQILVADRLVFDLRINMTVGDDEVAPAVVIHVHEGHTPSEELVSGQAGLA